jgi:uncharacterized protein
VTIFDPAHDITDLQALTALFGPVGEASIAKEIDTIDDNYRALIEASPFLALATAGPGGLDCSPRGDPRGVVEVIDGKTLILPERRGNNRIDSLRNLVHDPRLALLFLIPGFNEALRINGRARISTDPALLERCTMEDRQPKVVLVVTVDSVFFQCSRALLRSDLWNPEKHVPRASLPSAGRILQGLTAARIDGDAYDRELPARIKDSLY